MTNNEKKQEIIKIYKLLDEGNIIENEDLEEEEEVSWPELMI